MKTSLSYVLTGVLAAAAIASGASAQQSDATAKPVVAPLPPAASESASAAATAPADQAAVATGQADVTAAAGGDAKEFMHQVYLNNEFTIAAAQIAIGNAQSDAAKAAAQKLLNDGMKTRQDFVAAAQGATSDMNFEQAWTDDYKAKLADLKTAPATEFDAKYVATQAAVTSQEADAFSAYASAGTDASVKAFATATLPVLQADSAALAAAGTPTAAAPAS